MRQPILILWGAVAMVLLIGCVNIAGLLMARGVARAPEIATRMALGGGRGAILRQLLTESLVLAVAGGVAGAALGYAGSRAFASLLQDAFGVTPGDVGLDGACSPPPPQSRSAPACVFGLVPALQASRVNLRATLVESGSPSIAGAARSWPRRVLVVTEVALGVVLLVGAGLLIRSVDGLVNLRAGFDGTHVMTATLSLQDARYQSAETVNRFFDDSLARMREIAGVEQRGRGADAAVRARAERRRTLGRRPAGRRSHPDHEHDVRDAGVLRDAAHSRGARPRVHRGRRVRRGAGHGRQPGVRRAQLEGSGSDRPSGDVGRRLPHHRRHRRRHPAEGRAGATSDRWRRCRRATFRRRRPTMRS